MKLLFFTGKGGVGKSTISATTAWQLSRRHRVLIASLDPAHNLGDLFNLKLDGSRYRYSKNLTLLEVDVSSRIRDYLKREADILADTYKYLKTLNLDRYFSILKYSPGIEEYSLLTSIEEIVSEGAHYDYILFDTPPTGLTLRFLALSQITMTWLKRLIEIRRLILKKRHTIDKIRGSPFGEDESGETTLRYDTEDDRVLAKLLSQQDRYEQLNRRLQGEECSIVLVFNPDILSQKESIRLMRGLNELGLPLRLLIDNKITEDNRRTAEKIETELQQFADGAVLQRVAQSVALGATGAFDFDGMGENLTEHL